MSHEGSQQQEKPVDSNTITISYLSFFQGRYLLIPFTRSFSTQYILSISTTIEQSSFLRNNDKTLPWPMISRLCVPHDLTERITSTREST